MDEPGFRPLYWVGSALADLKELPSDVRTDVGYALWRVQQGDHPPQARPLKGIAPGSGVLEIVERYEGNAYRVVYTVRFAGAVYVLHAFRKKSRRGIETPKHDIDLIRGRLKAAEAHHRGR